MMVDEELVEQFARITKDEEGYSHAKTLYLPTGEIDQCSRLVQTRTVSRLEVADTTAVAHQHTRCLCILFQC